MSEWWQEVLFWVAIFVSVGWFYLDQIRADERRQERKSFEKTFMEAVNERRKK